MADFYIDHDVSRELAVLLRADGHAAVTARDLGRERAGDDQHLLVAAHQRLILVSHNAGDYRLLHAAWLHWTQAWDVAPEHAGILILPHGVPATNARLLSALIQASLPLANELYEWSRGRNWSRRVVDLWPIRGAVSEITIGYYAETSVLWRGVAASAGQRTGG